MDASVDLHRQAADALERLGGAADPRTVARLWLEAGDVGRFASGALAAARESRRQGEHPESLAVLETLLDRGDEIGDESVVGACRAQVHGLAARAARYSAASSLALGHCEAALADPAATAEERCSALCERAATLTELASPGARSATEQAVAAVQDLSDSAPAA